MDQGKTLAVVGLGYVGLPLALSFGKHLKTIAYDTDADKINWYLEKRDPAGEMAPESFNNTNVKFTTNPQLLHSTDFIIVTVPTPIDSMNKPLLEPLISCSKTIGEYLKPGCIVIYESTVYPGVTEEICTPILEDKSGLKINESFFVGYSPERVSPGDKTRTVENILKVISASCPQALDSIAELYELIIKPGVFKASSIRVAEASKVIENTQRDVNIGLANEFSMICHKLGLDTQEVLEAASTKWNFMPFQPGLVGGHCIGVDPFYLTHKSETLGYQPQIILAARRINEGMTNIVTGTTIEKLNANNIAVKNARILIMGLTFKENCADIRNSKALEIFQQLKEFGASPVTWDPLILLDPYDYHFHTWDKIDHLDAVICAVTHDEIKTVDLQELRSKCKDHPKIPFIDVKSCFDREKLQNLGFDPWRL